MGAGRYRPAESGKDLPRCGMDCSPDRGVDKDRIYSARSLVLLSYSYRRDSIGSRRAAFQAGNSPKTMPMPTLAPKPAIGAQMGTYDGIIIRTPNVSSQPSSNPTTPPKPVNVAASIKN